MKDKYSAQKRFSLFHVLFFSSFLLYIWIFSQTPYGQDDWAWGIDYGMRMLLTGGINSRYIGNLFEVIVTRSEFLKALLPGIIAATLPYFLVVFVKTRARPGLSIGEMVSGGKTDWSSETILLLANVLFLMIPLDVWQETYGWIAGFSNYGLAVWFLAVFQLLIFRVLLYDQAHYSPAIKVGYFLFSICIQLVLENMSIYIFLVDFLFLVLVLFEKRDRATKMLMFLVLLGNAIGLAVMFSSNIYTSLFGTGSAIGGYRSLSFDIHDGLFKSFLVLNERFVYFYPNNMFGSNWLNCSLISIFLFFLSGRGRKWVRLLIRAFAVPFALYFVLAHFLGPIEDYVSRWNEVLTQRLNLLFFWGTLLSIILLPWEGPYTRKILLFVWLSVPGIVLPLVAVKIVGSRYFLFSSLFLVEFCLFLLAEVYKEFQHYQKRLRVASGLILLAYLLVGAHRALIYYDIGVGKRERDKLILAAQTGETDRLYFADLPHSEYIEINEPLDGSEHVKYFREFYQIPDSVEMHNSLEDFSPRE